MRVTFLASAVLSAVTAFDLTYYSDEKCATPAMELKGDVGGSGVEGNVKTTHQTITGGAPGVCVTYAPEVEIAYSKDVLGLPDDAKVKLAFGKVASCDEYGSFSFAMYTKGYKECLPQKVTDLADDGSDHTLLFSGASSTCQPLGIGGGTADIWGTGQVGSGLSNKDGLPLGSYKANCNPKPGDVAGIVMGTLSVVFAFASIGLGAAAKAK